MKNFIITLLISVVSLLARPVQAQQWTFGPKVQIGLGSRQTVSQVQVGNVQVLSGGAGEAAANGVGAFARYDRPRWYGQIELNQAWNTPVGYFVSNANGLTSFQFSGDMSRGRTDGRLLIGYKPLPWLRISTGVVGVRTALSDPNLHQADIAYYEQLAAQNPAVGESYQIAVSGYQISRAISTHVKRTVAEWQAGIGADIGGLTVDIAYNASLDPTINGFEYNGQVFPLQQRYGAWSLQLGYRLLPLKAHLLAPRKRNPAYERIERASPFYRNEFHVAIGLLISDDIGGGFIYENRYTRYLSRRLGLIGGVNVIRAYEDIETGGIPNHFTKLQLITGLKLLPLYSHRHTIGFSLGPTLTYETGFSASSNLGQNIAGRFYQNVNWDPDIRRDDIALGWQALIDYQFAATDRLVVGPWFRIGGQSSLAPDYGHVGVQAGYRF